MMEYEADQFAALFIAATDHNPVDIYRNLGGDATRVSQLQQFVDNFSRSYGRHYQGRSALLLGAAAGGSGGRRDGAHAGSPVLRGGTAVARFMRMFQGGAGDSDDGSGSDSTEG